MDGILDQDFQKTTILDEYEIYKRLKSWYAGDKESPTASL